MRATVSTKYFQCASRLFPTVNTSPGPGWGFLKVKNKKAGKITGLGVSLSVTC